ncbi:hypothetical protein BKA93DRAFT_527267 [Sparassis latifolia]|uniref:Uncharacterized protein n=1 Tax=Sparassis crispa TaxID=139825 RepID=A0A401GKQ6_9APHY|nr:hypothetical protein SCP_0411310 [Sparassis crispa]GBE82746.1 hypothetical protein SCP_0411310 [Sparassis crispa]
MKDAVLPGRIRRQRSSSLPCDSNSINPFRTEERVQQLEHKRRVVNVNTVLRELPEFQALKVLLLSSLLQHIERKGWSEINGTCETDIRIYSPVLKIYPHVVIVASENTVNISLLRKCGDSPVYSPSPKLLILSEIRPFHLVVVVDGEQSDSHRKVEYLGIYSAHNPDKSLSVLCWYRFLSKSEQSNMGKLSMALEKTNQEDEPSQDPESDKQQALETYLPLHMLYLENIGLGLEPAFWLAIQDEDSEYEIVQNEEAPGDL